MKSKPFNSVWDALEDDPTKREIHKLRSELVDVISRTLAKGDLSRREVAHKFGVSESQVGFLLKGEFESFRLDSLIGFAIRCGHTLKIDSA